MLRILLCAIAIAVLIGLFVWLRPAPQTSMSAPVTGQQAAGKNTVYRAIVVVKDGRRSSGPAVIRAHQGQRVVLQVTCDHDDELHLHGYDLHLKLKKNQPANLNFIASHSGRFEYELHHAKLALGTLEVTPR